MKLMRLSSTYVAAYVLWAVSVVLSYFVIMKVRDAVLSLLVVSSLDRTASNARDLFYTGLQLRTAEVWSWLVFGLIMIVVIVVLEHYFRTSVEAGVVFSRFLTMIAILTGVFAIASLAMVLAAGAVQPLRTADFYLPILEIAVMGLAIWLRNWMANRQTPGSMILI